MPFNSRWTVKPPVGTPIDLSSPYAQGLVGAWAYPTSTANSSPLGLSDTSVNNRYELITNSQALRFTTAQAGTVASAATVNTLTQNAWNLCVARSRSRTDRDAVLNADFANKGSSATDLAPIGLNQTSIGRRPLGGASNAVWPGGVGLVLIYNWAIPDTWISDFYANPWLALQPYQTLGWLPKPSSTAITITLAAASQSAISDFELTNTPPAITAALAASAQAATGSIAVQNTPPPNTVVLAAAAQLSASNLSIANTPPVITATLAAVSQVATSDFELSNVPPAVTAVLAAVSGSATANCLLANGAPGNVVTLAVASGPASMSIAAIVSGGIDPGHGPYLFFCRVEDSGGDWADTKIEIA